MSWNIDGGEHWKRMDALRVVAGIGHPRPRDTPLARRRDTSASAFAIIGRLVLCLCCPLSFLALPLNFPLISPQSCCRRHADRPPLPAHAINAPPLDITHDVRDTRLASRVLVRRHTLARDCL